MSEEVVPKHQTSPVGVVPRHIAIIMDGNGRWATQQGLPRIVGHEKGAESVRESIEACAEAGVAYLTLYAFSKENWLRPREEVSGLMILLNRFLLDNTEELKAKNIRLQAIGRLTDLPGSCQIALHRAIEATAACSGLTVILALSYSGRLEIVDGIRSLLREIELGHLDKGMIDPETFSKHLYTRYYPDPDLVLRTSGEMRISNFLLWQISYAEIIFTAKLWPEFRKADLWGAIDEFGKRQRRFGAI